MTATATVVALLKNNSDQLTNIASTNIHAYSISAADWTDDAPLILVTDIGRSVSLYGNDNVGRELEEIQIQLYYPANYTGDMDMIESALITVLRANKYYCSSNAGHVMTPDTKNILNTLKFKHTK